MSEKEIAKTPQKEHKKKDSGRKSPAEFITGKFNDYKGEFKKIIWPDRKELVKHTVNVVITSLLVGAVIIVMDLVFSNAYNLFIRFFG